MGSSSSVSMVLRLLADFSDVSGNINQLQQKINGIKLPSKFQGNFNNIFADLEKETVKYQKLLNSGFKTKGDITGLEASGQKINTLLQRVQVELGKINGVSLSKVFEVDPSKIKQAADEVAKWQEKIKQITSAQGAEGLLGNIDTTIKDLGKITSHKAFKSFKDLFNKGDMEGASAALQELEAHWKKLEKSSNQTGALDLISKLSQNLNLLKSNPALTEYIKNLEEAKKAQANLAQTEFDKTLKNIEAISPELANIIKNYETLRANIDGTANSQHQFNNEMNMLKQRISYFFGINNAINLVKRTIRESINTVKELDKAMTETAVVTDFTVGDMWEKLPQYSKQASKLGASIKDLYNATTLYYQQGLNSQQAMTVGVETMKMARIAGMEASDATTAMTAALRGFNMEIDETSATRINDVYSELAAITAADTNQIATAMGKTASIANSANMEFETTAALLAQIIETTQEAPETAGTAMKTIIARFTEVKELFSEGMLSGEDEEGEEININKIDAALKSVGISLRDFLRGEKGIDDIFLELAAKWDTLDLATQRYIATTAAGSRQQSRFIAMMSNYDRTMELVTAANNSAGASQNQYEKTLESMESKLQRLENAWNTFIMNLANNDALKVGVDILTSFLNVINGLTDALSGGNTLGKTLVSFMGTFAAFKGGKSLLGYGAEKLFGVKLFQEGNGIFAKALETSGIGMKKTGEKMVQSVFTGFERGIRLHSFKDIFTEAFDEEAFRQNAQSSLKTLQQTMSKSDLDDEALEKYKKQEELLKKAAEGDTKAGKQAGMVLDNYKKTQKGLTGVASAAMAAGVGFNLFGAGLNNLGLEEQGEAISNFGTNLLSLGSVAAMVAPLLKTLGITAGPLAIAIGGIALALTALPYVFNAIKAASPEGKLEAAREATQKATEAAESAENSYSNLKTAVDSLDEKYKSLDRMTKGTQQWKESAHALNEEVSNLIEKYPELQGQFEYKDGVLTKKEGADVEIQKALNQEQINSYQAKQIETQAKINEQIAERNVLDINQVDNIIKSRSKNYGSRDYKAARRADASAEFIQQIAIKAAQGEVTEETIAEEVKNAGYLFNDIEGSFGKIRTYGELLLEDQQRYDAQIANNIKTQAQLAGHAQDQISELDSNLITDVREKAYETEYDAIKEINEDIRQEFANLYNYRKSGDEFFYKDSGAKVEGITDEAIRTAVASARADTATVEAVAKATDMYGSDSVIARALSEDGMNLKSADIQGLVDGEGKFVGNIDELFGNIDLNGIAIAMGIEVDQLKNNLVQNIESASDRIVDQRKDLVSSMNKYSKISKQNAQGTLSDINANILRNLEDFYGEDFRNTLDNVFASLERSGDDSIISAGYGNFISQALSGIDKTELTKLSNFITDIDWSSPIEAAYQLNREVEYGSGLSQEFAKNITSVKQGYLGAGSQMRYLVHSSDFEEIQGELDTILETSDEITALDVLNLSDSYASLNKMLKNTETSASGVAKALQAVSKGDIQVDQLTDAVLASLSGFDTLSSMIAELQKKLQDFDVGIDENFATEFIAQAGEAINSNLEKGAVGNSQINKYLDLLFTENWDEGLTGESRVERMRELGEVLADNSESMSSFWGMIAENQTWQNNLLAGNFRVNKNSKGEIELSGYKGMTTQEQAAALVEASKGTGYEISQTMAEMLITDFKNYSRDYEYSMSTQEQDSLQVAQNTLDALKISEDGRYYIDQSEIDTIETLTGLSGIGEKLQQLTDGALAITDFYKEDGTLKEAKELITKMAEVQGQDLESYKSSKFGYKASSKYVSSSGVYVETGELDMSQIENQLAELGLPQEAKTQIAQDVVDSFFESSEYDGGTFELSFEASDGSIRTIGLKAGESVQQAIANEELTIKNEALAQSIATAFQGTPIPVMVQPNTGDIEGLSTDVTANLVPNMDAITSALSGLSATVTLFPSIFGHAKGIKNSPTTHDALVGEEGPELIERQDGTAYLSGVNGPEVTTVNTGDTVHTAEETQKIFRQNKGISFPRFYDGYDPPSSTGYGDEKKKKSSGKSKEWENPYDKLYNLLREINEELRQRERLERRYEKLLTSLDVDANKIIEISRTELKQLEEEKKLQEELIASRERQIEMYLEENKDLQKYAFVEKNERGEQVLRIDWDAIDAVKDTEEGESIETYVGQLEEWFDSLEEAEDALWDIEDAVSEIKERGKDEFFDFEDMVKEALVDYLQDYIDGLEGISDAISEADSKLIESIQQTIDKQRQDRDNQETEAELAEKQRRLMYLSQDTSGANDLEILKLQKEIDEGQQSYTDSLIDRKISDLQQQNDEAAQQRQDQIDILNSQLDFAVETGKIWDTVYTLLSDGLEKGGVATAVGTELMEQFSPAFNNLTTNTGDIDTGIKGLVKGSQLEALLNKQKTEGLSVLGAQEAWKEIQNQLSQAISYLKTGRQLEEIGMKEGTELTFTNNLTGKTITGKVDKYGNVTDGNGWIYDNVYQGADGKYYADGNIKSQEELKGKKPESSNKTEKTDKSTENNSGENPKTAYYSATAIDGTVFTKTSQAAADKAATEYNTSLNQLLEAYLKTGETESNKKALVGNINSLIKKFDGSAKEGYNYEELIRKLKEGQKQKKQKKQSGGGSKNVQMVALSAFATGGLADYTGPAWLDGTKSRPELVLNAQDTKNFIQLKDILSSIMTGSITNRSDSTENNGDTYYDVDINVENLSSDYDVEKVAGKVKSMINQDARYRNNNTISLKR